jgi:DNA-binding MarR family transcriptional regulator
MTQSPRRSKATPRKLPRGLAHVAAARAPSLDEIAALQASSLGYLLIRVGQLWNERAIARVNSEAGAPVLRDAHTRLFPHLLGEDGARIVDLAAHLAVTKQAIAPLVQELADLGFVRVDIDDDDARARRVHLTRTGRAAMAHGTGVLIAIEDEVRPALGTKELRALHRQLTALVAALTAAPDAPPARAVASSPTRAPRRAPRS